jgi:hypothetical protein
MNEKFDDIANEMYGKTFEELTADERETVHREAQKLKTMV